MWSSKAKVGQTKSIACEETSDTFSPRSDLLPHAPITSPYNSRTPFCTAIPNPLPPHHKKGNHMCCNPGPIQPENKHKTFSFASFMNTPNPHGGGVWDVSAHCSSSPEVRVAKFICFLVAFWVSRDGTYFSAPSPLWSTSTARNVSRPQECCCALQTV